MAAVQAAASLAGAWPRPRCQTVGGGTLHDLLTLAIFAATIACVLIRPRGISETVWAVVGAVAMLAVGVVSPHAALQSVSGQWDVLLFFAGLLLVAWASEQAGVFRWAARRAARAANGRADRLFLNVVLAGVVLTTVLSNDATALLLTPVVVGLTVELGLPPKPYAFACAFIANSASLTLPVSNPLNILVLGSGGISLGDYAAHLLPASLIVIVLTALLLRWRFRAELRGGFGDPVTSLAGECASPEQTRVFRLALVTLALLVCAYIFTSVVGWPLAYPVTVAGLVLVAIVNRVGRLPLRTAAAAPWSIVPFVAALLVLVRGLEGTGLTRALGDWLLSLERHGTGAGVFGATGLSALGSNAINNLPMGAVMLSALRTAHAQQYPGLLYGTLLGADVGPNLTALGSLSTVLWLVLLRRAGIAVSAREFLRLGLLVTPVLLLAGALAVALSGT